jgi:hypothetical protein
MTLPFLPADGALPLSIALVALGMAAFANGMFFAGYGSEPAEGGAHPVKTVGVISLVAGLLAFWTAGIMAFVIGGPGIAVAGLLTLYAMFFTTLGITAWQGLDLKPIANICIVIAIGSLPYIFFKGFDKDLLFQSTMVVWTIAFAAIWAVVYGKWGIQAKWLGWILIVTSIWTFFLPALRLVMGANWLVMS